MNDSPIRVLLVEDNPGDADLLRVVLADAPAAHFTLEWVDRLAAGLERLAGGGIGLVLLDLSLPDSTGLDTFTEVHAAAPHVPVIVLSGLDDEALSLKALQV